MWRLINNLLSVTNIVETFIRAGLIEAAGAILTGMNILGGYYEIDVLIMTCQIMKVFHHNIH